MAYNAGASTGNLVLLSRQTATGATSVNFTSLITTAYDDYVVRITKLTGNQAFADVLMRFSSDNGSTWISAANYNYSVVLVNSGGNFLTNFAGQTSGTVFYNNENVANSQGGVIINLFNITAGTKFPIYQCTPYYGTTLSTLATIGGNYGVATAVNALQFIPSAGTFTGQFNLYGVQL